MRNCSKTTVSYFKVSASTSIRILATVLGIALRLSAQQVTILPGVVVEQNSQFNTGKVIYLPDTEIKAAGNSTTSDANGQFALVFANQPVSNTVWVHAAKKGYDLVNSAEIAKVAVAGRIQPMKVVMCKAGQLYENQIAYYNIARDAKVTSYEKRMAILDRQGKEKEALLAQMAQDFNVERLSADSARALLHTQLLSAQAQAQELANQFVTINLDDQSSTYQRAFRAFIAKDIEGAIRIMDSVDFRGRIDQNLVAISKAKAIIGIPRAVIDSAEAQIRQDIEQVVLLARMHRLNYGFVQADSLYELAIRFGREAYRLGTKNLVFDIEFEQIRNSRQRQQLERAYSLGERLLNSMEKSEDVDPNEMKRRKAKLLNELGCIAAERDSFVDASKRWKTAENIYTQLLTREGRTEEVEAEKDLYLRYRAIIQCNLGKMFLLEGKPEDALAQYAAAHQSLSSMSHDTASPEVLLQHVEILNGVGLASRAFVDGNKAAFQYSKSLMDSSLSILGVLYKDNASDELLLRIAVATQARGLLLDRSGLESAADSDLVDSHLMLEHLSGKAPELFKVYLERSQEMWHLVNGMRSELYQLKLNQRDAKDPPTKANDSVSGSTANDRPFIGLHQNTTSSERSLDDSFVFRPSERVRKIIQMNLDYQKFLDSNRLAIAPETVLASQEPALPPSQFSEEIGYEYATYLLQDLKQFSRAKMYFLQLLDPDYSNAERDNVPPKEEAHSSSILCHLGVIYKSTNELDSAMHFLKEALEISWRLIQANQSEYAKLHLKNLLELGDLFQTLNEMNQANTHFEQAVLLARELTALDASAYLGDLAGALDAWGAFHTKMNNFWKAKACLEEAQNIYRELARNNPDAYLPSVTKTLNNLGFMLYSLGELAETRAHYEEALKIRRDLARKNPDAYLPDVALTLNNLGILLQDIGELIDARACYEEALEIRRDLARKNPDAYLPFVATTQTYLGGLLNDIGEMDVAMAYYEEALKIRRELAQRNPEAFLPDVAMTLNNLSILLQSIGDLENARTQSEEALRIRRELARKNPDSYLPDLATTLNNLGNLLDDIGDLTAARIHYEEALQIYRELARKNPDTYSRETAATMNNLGILLQIDGEPTLAWLHYQEALQVNRELARKNPNAYLPDVAMTLNNIGLLASEASNLPLAIQQLEEALAIREQLIVKNPTAYGVQGCQSAIPLAMMQYDLLESTGDLQHRTEGLALLEKASQFLAVYKKTTPKIIQFSKDIDTYTQKFKSFRPEDRAALAQLALLEAAVEAAPTPHDKILRQQTLIQALEDLLQADPQSLQLPPRLPKEYGSLAWYHLFDRDFPAAEAAARKGLALAPDETWIYTNLALALLYQGRWDEAQAIYTRLKDQPYGDATYGKTFLEDLDALEQAGITHPDVARARRLLR